MKPLPPDMSQIEQVLLIKLSSIGDVIHALPVSAALGEAYPHLRLTWIVEERAAPMVLGNPYLHEVIVLPRLWPLTPRLFLHNVRLLRALRARRFDLALDLQGLLRSGLIALWSGARYRLGWDYLREFSSLMVRRIRRRPESQHVVDQLLDVARFLGAPVSTVKFPLHIPPQDDARALELLASAGIFPGEPFIAINPTEGGNGNKGLGADRVAGLVTRLGGAVRMPVVLVGGRVDLPVAAVILNRAVPPPANLVGRTTLKQLAAILNRAVLHVCGDSGSAHLAAALGKPVVSVYGRTNPARLSPYGQGDSVIHHRDQCQPDCRRFHDTAPLNCNQSCSVTPPPCLAAITVEEIVHAVHNCVQQVRPDLLAETNPGNKEGNEAAEMVA